MTDRPAATLPFVPALSRVATPVSRPRALTGGAARDRGDGWRRDQRLGLACFCLLVAAGSARVQGAEQTPAAGPPPPAVSAAPPAPLPAGTHLGAAEVPIVGGNLASARERALAEAMKQAVGDALGVVAPDARTSDPKLVVQVLARARTFVQRYRTREDGEVGQGRYGVKIEAEVDEASLGRAFEKAPAAAPLAAGAPSYLLVANGPPEAADAVYRALAAGGTRVERAREVLSNGPAAEFATHAGLGAIIFANASANREGQVRGVGLEAVSCTVAVRLAAAGTAAALAEDTRTERSFAEHEEGARKDCLARAAGVAVRHVIPQTGTGRSPSDLRTVVADVDVVEPGAVLALLKQLRGSGSVSAVDLRRLLPGRAELAIRSRLTAPALAAAIGRDSSGPVVISGVEVSGELIRMVARAREVPAPAAPPPPGAAPPSLPAASPAGAPALAPAPAPTRPPTP